MSEGFLPSPGVEIEAALECVQPIGGMIDLVDGGDRVRAHLNLDGIAAGQTLPVFAIKSNTGFAPCITGDVTAQHNVIREHHGTETEDVRTNGRNEDARDGGMDDRRSSGQTVRGGAGGGGKDNPVGLDGRQMDVIDKALQCRQVR